MFDDIPLISFYRLSNLFLMFSYIRRSESEEEKKENGDMMFDYTCSQVTDVRMMPCIMMFVDVREGEREAFDMKKRSSHEWDNRKLCLSLL